MIATRELRAAGKVLVIVARLEGLDDDLADELDRLKLEIEKEEAELRASRALEGSAPLSVVAGTSTE